MGNIMKVNSGSMIAFSAKDAYGADFKVNIFDMKTGDVIIKDASLTEGVEPVVPAATTVAIAQDIGMNEIVVADAKLFNPADRVSIGEFIYRIQSINTTTNTLVLNKGLLIAAAVKDAVTRVGNLSAFYVELYVTKIGFFLIQARDSKYGLQYTESVDVRSVLLDETLNQIEGNMGQVVEETKTISNFKIII